jgi:hypothetical protein
LWSSDRNSPIVATGTLPEGRYLSEAVDSRPAEPGAVLTRGQGGYVVRSRALRDHGEVGAPKHGAGRPAREAGEHVRRVCCDRRIEAGEVLLEEAAINDAALDVEPWILRIAPLEFVRTDDAAWAQTLDLQWLPDKNVLVLCAGRQHQQAARRRGIDRVLKRGRAGAGPGGGAGTVTTGGL